MEDEKKIAESRKPCSPPTVTPGGGSELDQIFVSALQHSFAATAPRDVLPVFEGLLSSFREKLLIMEPTLAQEHISLLDEILVNHLREQQPALFSRIVAALKSAMETELVRIVELYERISEGEGKGDPKERMEIIRKKQLESFRYRVRSEIGPWLPGSLVRQYASQLEDTIDDAISNRLEFLECVRQRSMGKDEWIELCSDSFKNIAPIFDPKRIGLSDAELANALIGVARTFAFSRKRFDSTEELFWRQLVAKFFALLPDGPALAETREKILLRLDNKVTIEERTELSRGGALLLLSAIQTANVHTIGRLTFDIFLALSGFYDKTKRSLEAGPYPPLLRDGIRKMLQTIRKCAPELGPCSVSLGRLFAFDRYRQFESCLGAALFDPLKGGWNDYGEIELLPYIKHFISSEERKKKKLIGMQKRLAQGISEAKLFTLQNLTPERTSPHVWICFSGFMSEKDDHEISWGRLLAANREDRIYVVKWAGSTFWDTVKSGLLPLLAAIPGFFSRQALPLAAIYAASTVGNMCSGVFDQFLAAEKRAKQVGYLMAHTLVNSEIFRGCDVSLMGFSLGTRAVLSCVKTLHKIGQNKVGPQFLLGDVVLLGGAAVIKKGKSEMWRKRLGVVNGRIVNCFARNDWALRLFCLAKRAYTTGDYPIGMIKIEYPPEPGKAVTIYKTRVQNYDVTDLVSGHLGYRAVLNKILQLVKFC